MMGMREVEKLRRLSLVCRFPIIPSVFIIFSRENRLGTSQPFILQVREVRALDVHGCKRFHVVCVFSYNGNLDQFKCVTIVLP